MAATDLTNIEAYCLVTTGALAGIGKVTIQDLRVK